MTAMKKKTSANKKVIRDIRGFTLSEALVTVIILLLVSAIVAAGVPAAANAYRKVVITSNAEVIRSTTMSALRNELATSKDVRISGENGSKIFFYNEAYGSMSEISLGKKDEEEGVIEGEIMYQRYAKDGLIVTNDNATADAKPLVPDKYVYPSFTSVSYNDETGVVTFHGLVVKRISNNEEMTDNTDYSVRVLVK